MRADDRRMASEHSGDHPRDGEQNARPGQWLPLGRAAKELSLSRAGVYRRIRAGTLDSRPRGNRGLEVFVADDRERSADHSPDGERDVRADDAELEELREELTAARIAMARLEERLVAAERRDTDLQAGLELERARADRLAADLALARKGWLERLLEAVRRQ
jgi:hypothetical protein